MMGPAADKADRKDDGAIIPDHIVEFIILLMAAATIVVIVAALEG